MDADFTIELGREDPVLEFPWTDPEGKCAYYDLKHHPEQLAHIEEAGAFAELAEFLRMLNSAMSMVESAKCDIWTTGQLTAEEEIFAACCKCASYVDIVFSAEDRRFSFPLHELLAKRLVELLRKTPETPSSAEACVRRCFFRRMDNVVEGFYVTLYVTGYGDDAARARKTWGIASRLAANAILQLSASGLA